MDKINISDPDFSVISEAYHVGKRNDFEERHAYQVCRLSLALFDQLKGLHQLENRDRSILATAAMLHDVGTARGFIGHHKHSRDIILEARFPHFSKEEVLLIANVARYHRKGSPQKSHGAYNKLSKKQKEQVQILSAMLRMADALDREHWQKINTLTVKPNGKSLIFQADADSSLLPESWALEKKSKQFTDLFGLKVRLDVIKGTVYEKA